MSMSLKEATTIVWNHFMKTVGCFVFFYMFTCWKIFRIKEIRLTLFDIDGNLTGRDCRALGGIQSLVILGGPRFLDNPHVW